MRVYETMGDFLLSNSTGETHSQPSFKVFTKESFKCKCNKCNCDDVHQSLIDFLNYYFEQTKDMPTILSGCRCVAHNAKVKGKPESDHICIPGVKQTIAVDVAAITVEQRSNLIKYAFKSGMVERVIVYPEKKFIHFSVNKKLINPLVMFNLKGNVY